MAIENVQLIESIILDKADPRCKELVCCAGMELGFEQDKYGNWYVRGTGEPVSFASKKDEAAYTRGRPRWIPITAGMHYRAYTAILHLGLWLR
jgi:hypothetical protein